jgi:hypothetical protein
MDLFPSLGPAMNERAGTSEVMRQVIDRAGRKAHPGTHVGGEHLNPGAAPASMVRSETGPDKSL